MGLTKLVAAKGGPEQVVLVRHGESVGNLADAAARERGAERLDLTVRDADVELSGTGRDQADALGEWLSRAPESSRPTLVLSSPYRRAAETAERAVKALSLDVVVDDRLRERDLGLFDGLTAAGLRSLYPQEAERRRKVGKFYYQPPSGESWTDVALRVRSLLADLRDGFETARVWMFAHQAVILSFRYVLEGLDEQALLEIDASRALGNASVTTYRRSDAGLELVAFADTSAVAGIGAGDVTHEPAQAGRGDDTRAE